MSTVAEVLAWPLDALQTAATEFAVAGESAANAAGSLKRTFDIDPTWSGRTRQAAEARVAAESTRLTRLSGTFIDVAGTLRTGRGRMGAVQDRLHSQLQAARVSGFNVDDDGAVAHPDPKRRADADYLMERIRLILEEADQADVVLSQTLTVLTGQLDGSGTLVPLPNGEYRSVDEAANAVSAMTPEEVQRYWDSLTEAERTSLLTGAPNLIGNLNGIDFADRARANRISIREALAKEVAAGRGDGDQAERLRELLEPARDPLHPDRTVPRTFLGFHNVGNGQFIELVGELNPDSPGVAVLVPGTGTGLHSAGDYRRRAANIAKASNSPVIVYADGQFPQTLYDKDLTPLAGTAADPRPAADIAPDLVAFTADLDRQLRASGLQTPTTVIGHSYGGAVVGTAEQLGMRADRVVYASASGTGVNDGPWDDRNPAVERYSVTPPGDPIQYWQQWGATLHGGDPDTAPGVTRLDSGRYSDGSLVAGPQSHTGYLDDEGSDALRNIGAVVAGGDPTPYVEREPDLDIGEDLGTLVHDWLAERLRLVPGD